MHMVYWLTDTVFYFRLNNRLTCSQPLVNNCELDILCYLISTLKVKTVEKI